MSGAWGPSAVQAFVDIARRDGPPVKLDRSDLRRLAELALIGQEAAEAPPTPSKPEPIDVFSENQILITLTSVLPEVDEDRLWHAACEIACKFEIAGMSAKEAIENQTVGQYCRAAAGEGYVRMVCDE